MLGEIKVSIFEVLKQRNCVDGTKGQYELKKIYVDNGRTIKEQMMLAERFADKVLSLSEQNGDQSSLNLEDMKIVDCIPAFMLKINALVKEKIIDERWIHEFTRQLVFESDSMENVKLGLVLSERYLMKKYLKEAVRVYAQDGEYVFYLIRVVKNMTGYNSFLYKLAKRSTGTVRVFAITNMDVVNNTIRDYILEEGYRDDFFGTLLVSYIVSVVDIEGYFNDIENNRDKLREFDYFIYRHLRACDLKKSPIKEFIKNKYVKNRISNGEGFYALISLLLIGQKMAENDVAENNVKHEYYPIVNALKNEVWKSNFEDEIYGSKATTMDLVEIANFYDYRFSEEQLRELNRKHPMDFYLYWYVFNKEDYDKRILYWKLFKQQCNYNSLFFKDNDEWKKPLGRESLIEGIFSMIVKGFRDFYPQGKNIALEGISGQRTEIRFQSLKNLIIYKDRISDEETEKIRYAGENEWDYNNQGLINKIMYRSVNSKVEYININKISKRITQKHVKDVFLMSTYVSGLQFVNMEHLNKALKNSTIYYLIHDITNQYDDKAIKIVSEDGYVIGFIPKKDNTILCNLLDKNVLLYVLVKDYSFEESHISIEVYISYKNVLNEAEEIFSVLTSKENGAYQN